MVIQTRVFRRLIRLGDSGNKVMSGLDEAIDAVVAEVNTFIAPLGDRCLDVVYKIEQIDHYEHAVYTGTVAFIE